MQMRERPISKQKDSVCLSKLQPLLNQVLYACHVHRLGNKHATFSFALLFLLEIRQLRGLRPYQSDVRLVRKQRGLLEQFLLA